MKMDVMQLTKEELEYNMNLAKEIIIASLVNEGFLEAEAADEYVESYAVVLRRKGWLGRVIDKVRRGPEGDGYAVEIVYLVDQPQPPEKPKKKPKEPAKVIPLRREDRRNEQEEQQEEENSPDPGPESA